MGGALLYSGLAPLPARPALPAGRSPARLEWGLPLTRSSLLLGAFVALQLATLFGGRATCSTPPASTYAEYARSGFAQLLVVAALTLAVIAAAHRWARGGRLLRVLLAALCLLTLVVLASALKRLGLYEDAFGFTRLRFAAHAILLWLGAMFLPRAGRPRGLAPARRAGHHRRRRSSLFALADPDRRIAEHNVRALRAHGLLDRAYVARLSADAIPALAGLAVPRRSSPTRSAAASILARAGPGRVRNC